MPGIDEGDASIIVDFFKEIPEDDVSIENLTKEPVIPGFPSAYCVLNPDGKVKALLSPKTSILDLMVFYPGLTENPDELFGGRNLVPYFQDYFTDLKKNEQIVKLYDTQFFRIPRNVDKLDELIILETKEGWSNHIREIPESVFRAPNLKYLCAGPELEKLPELSIDSTNLKVLDLNEAWRLRNGIPKDWIKKANGLGVKVIEPLSTDECKRFDTNTLLAWTVCINNVEALNSSN